MAAPNNAVVQPLAAFRCPSDPRFYRRPDTSYTGTSVGNSYYGVSGGGPAPDCGNYACGAPNSRGMYVTGVLFSGSRVAAIDITDGTTNTFLLGESRYGFAEWAASAKQNDCAYAQNLAGAQDQINLYTGEDVWNTRGFSSYHSGGCYFALCDGSARFVSQNIDLATYRQLGRRNDGLPVGGGALMPTPLL